MCPFYRIRKPWETFFEIPALKKEEGAVHEKYSCGGR
jgi:hypothetical protein